MGRSIFRQETQIRQSDVYTDNIAPTEAAFETNPTNLETDLNNIRSQLHNLLENQAGNWWDDLNIPSALDTGTQRGVNDLNTDLHAIERKRILRRVEVIGAGVAVPAAAAASGTLTGTSNFSDTETVTLDSKTYTFQTTLTDVDGNVQIGVDLQTSLANLKAAINLEAGAGTLYATSTTLHPTVTATASDATTLSVEAKASGTVGNAIATTETAANASFGGATLSGGAGDVALLDAAGELPGNTTIAVDAVTTLGTIAAYEASFGTATLTDVTGGNALVPKNLTKISDTATGDIITDGSGREIHALLQSESNTDGHTATTSSPTQLQLSFVVHNATNDDLELADATFIGGKTVDYAAVERYSFEDIPEHAWLSNDFVDAGSASTTRQGVYDNQGATPVNVTTNSILDLEGAGLIWEIRDDLEASLLRVIEGSAGGTSEVEISAGVDTFDVNAVVNDFENGASFDTGAAGTTINIGTTANQIDSGGALDIVSTAADLSLAAGLELNFTDSYRAGSTWSLADGIALANSSAEWSAFETEFGEVSLLDAIVQASAAGGIRKVFSVVTAATIAANSDASGPSNDNNLDTDLGDLSGGTFVDDYDVYLNGQLLRGGADAAANHDYYPGTSLANGQLKFEFILKINDQLCIMDRVA